MKKILSYSTLLFASALMAHASTQLAQADSLDQEEVRTELVQEQTKTPEYVPVVSVKTDDWSQGQLSYTEQDQANISANSSNDSSYTSSGSRTVNTYRGGYTITYPGDGGQPIIIYHEPKVDTWTWTYDGDNSPIDTWQPVSEEAGENLSDPQSPSVASQGEENQDSNSGTEGELDHGPVDDIVPLPSQDTIEEPVNPADLGATTGASWQEASATIYLDPNLDTAFQQAYLEAINQWNQTGAFNFTIVNNIKDANIIATQEYNAYTNAAGVTESRYDPYAGRMYTATIKLNAYYLLNPRFGYNQERITNTAAHELGHAIGLDHNDGDSLMQPAGSYKGIRPVDINTVRQLYKKNRVSKPSWT